MHAPQQCVTTHKVRGDAEPGTVRRRVRPPSPTEEERMERHAALLRKQRAVKKKVGEGRSKVEKAKAKVAEEEGRLAEVEAELAEKARREEAARAREPRCMVLKRVRKRKKKLKKTRRSWKVAKRRKVVRKGRFYRAGEALMWISLFDCLKVYLVRIKHFACERVVHAVMLRIPREIRIRLMHRRS